MLKQDPLHTCIQQTVEHYPQLRPKIPGSLTHQEKIVVEVTQPAASVGGAGIGSAINYQLLGDTDI